MVDKAIETTTPMNLIYTIAYGSDAWHQSVLMVQSLRTLGQFVGDIVVYTNFKHEQNGAIVVTNSDPCAFVCPHWGKPYFGRSMDVSRYAKVMFMDCDIVAVNPVDPMFALDGIAVSVDGEHGSSVPGMFGIPTHPWRPGQFRCNSGVIMADAAIWNTLCDAWWECVMQVKGTDETWPWPQKDQGPLNHILRNNPSFSDKTAHFNHKWIYLFFNWQSISSEVILIHPVIRSKERVMKTMLEIYGTARIH